MFVDSGTERLKHRLKCMFGGSVTLFDRNRKVLKRSDANSKQCIDIYFIFIHTHTHICTVTFDQLRLCQLQTPELNCCDTQDAQEYLLSKINLTHSIPEWYKTPQRLKGLSQSCGQERNKILRYSSKSCRCTSPRSMTHIYTLNQCHFTSVQLYHSITEQILKNTNML